MAGSSGSSLQCLHTSLSQAGYVGSGSLGKEENVLRHLPTIRMPSLSLVPSSCLCLSLSWFPWRVLVHTPLLAMAHQLSVVHRQDRPQKNKLRWLLIPARISSGWLRCQRVEAFCPVVSLSLPFLTLSHFICPALLRH